MAAGKKTKPRWFVMFKEFISVALVITLLVVFLGDLTGKNDFNNNDEVCKHVVLF